MRKDDLLGIPAAREELGPQQGDTVEVIVRKPTTCRKRTENPLYRLVGIGKGGPPDGAENHDKCLYGSGPIEVDESPEGMRGETDLIHCMWEVQNDCA
ncbi:hypothetical protein HYR99_25025 [Candidatus Poribacteria bacterium]|nr:hypothetical protein [Candidatus Poribacteria bacterium]